MGTPCFHSRVDHELYEFSLYNEPVKIGTLGCSKHFEVVNFCSKMDFALKNIYIGFWPQNLIPKCACAICPNIITTITSV